MPIPPFDPKEAAWLLKEKYNGVESDTFHADVKRLKNGEPLAYVIGWMEFLGCKIDVSMHPMIPRVETEFWVERAIKELKSKNLPSLRLADTYSGSGCIGIALLKHIPNATVDISEYDPALKRQIELNVRLNGIDERRAKVWTADSLDGLTEEYDAIFANPPYIDPAALPEMDESVTHFEPHLALFAEDRGLHYIKLIVDAGWKFLKPGGTFYIECDAHQKEWIDEIMIGTPWKYEFWQDQYGQIRFLILRKQG